MIGEIVNNLILIVMKYYFLTNFSVVAKAVIGAMILKKYIKNTEFKKHSLLRIRINEVFPLSCHF
jgi:hypothetical protein